MNYSLHIMMIKEMISMEAKGELEAALAASPLISSQSSDLIYVFSISTLPRHKITHGGGYI
jgi:hypothetical protein